MVFDGPKGRVHGTVIRVNKKSVSVDSGDGSGNYYRVSPHLLRLDETVSDEIARASLVSHYIMRVTQDQLYDCLMPDADEETTQRRERLAAIFAHPGGELVLLGDPVDVNRGHVHGWEALGGPIQTGTILDNLAADQLGKGQSPQAVGKPSLLGLGARAAPPKMKKRLGQMLGELVRIWFSPALGILMRSKRAALSMAGRIRLEMNGFDDDPRPLFHIPEVRAWLLRLYDLFPWLGAWLNTDAQTGMLLVGALAPCDMEQGRPVVKQEQVEAAVQIANFAAGFALRLGDDAHPQGPIQTRPILDNSERSVLEEGRSPYAVGNPDLSGLGARPAPPEKRKRTNPCAIVLVRRWIGPHPQLNRFLAIVGLIELPPDFFRCADEYAEKLDDYGRWIQR